jgi:hypothetical protein
MVSEAKKIKRQSIQTLLSLVAKKEAFRRFFEADGSGCATIKLPTLPALFQQQTA